MIANIRKRLLEFCLFFICIVAPTFAITQQIETKISANTITVSPEGILQAAGNVEVNYGAIKVKAKALSFDRQKNSLRFENIYEFHDGKEIKFSATEAEINAELSEGIIIAAKLLLDETIKIRAEEVKFKNTEISEAKSISRITSCDECEGKEPKWYLTASSAKRDFENSNIIYRNVSVRVKGIPIVFLPYLRMPDPSIDRAQGFLVPEAAITSNLGTGIKLPYFVPMGLSQDILLTPYFSPKTKTIEYRYRQNFYSGNLTVNGGFSDDELLEDNLRYFFHAVGSFDLKYGVNFSFDAGKVGDALYFGDYVYSDESDLNSEINLGKTLVDSRQFFNGNLSYFREQDQGSALDEYFSLSGQYRKHISLDKFPGKFSLFANLNSSLNVNDDNSFSRPPSSAQVGANYNHVNFFGPLRFSNKAFGIYNSFVNSADAGIANEEFAFQYGASSVISIPFVKKGIERNDIFTPKISIAVNGQENDIIGDYFIGSDELSWGNVYSGKKISSLSESEKGFSISLGFDHEAFWENDRRLQLSFAASKIDNLSYVPALEYGFSDLKFNYLGRFSYSRGSSKTLSSNTLFASNGDLLHGDFRGTYAYENIKLTGVYEYFNHDIDQRLSENIKTFNFKTSYDFLESLNIYTGGRYDLTLEKMAKTSIGLGISFGDWQYSINQKYLMEESDKFSISAIYDDECTRFTFSFENRYQEFGSSEPVKSLTLRVQLKPFANFVVSQGTDQIVF